MDSYFEEAMYKFRDWPYDRIEHTKQRHMRQRPFDHTKWRDWELRMRGNLLRDLASGRKNNGDVVCVMHTLIVYLTTPAFMNMSKAVVNIAFNPAEYGTYFKAMGLLDGVSTINNVLEFIQYDQCTITLSLESLRRVHALPDRTKEILQAGSKRNIGEMSELWEFLHSYFLLNRIEHRYNFKF